MALLHSTITNYSIRSSGELQRYNCKIRPPSPFLRDAIAFLRFELGRQNREWLEKGDYAKCGISSELNDKGFMQCTEECGEENKFLQFLQRWDGHPW
jgi:hypothetical protein